jgi:DNA-directed RNA polymerase specialized sigma subunit
MTYATMSTIIADATPAAISAEEEATLVYAAQTGDEEAVTALMRQYAPALRNAIARASETLDEEDAEQEAALAFLTLLQAHDPATGRLAGRVKEYLADGMGEAAAKSNGWTIPARTTKRFFSILKAADGDVAAGERLASEMDMAPATFVLLASLLRETGSIEALTERAEADGSVGADGGVIVGGGSSDPFLDVDDALLVQGLLALLDERETPIIRFSYGFDDLPLAEDEDAKEGLAKTRQEGYAVANDGVVARHLGMARSTVARVRAQALATMRDALTETA